MTLSQFKYLDELEQQEALWDKGVPIDQREEGEYRIQLYQLDAFYVEAYFHLEHDQLHRFRAFNDPEELKPYLNKIKLP